MPPTTSQHSRALPGSRQLLERYAACLISRWDQLLQARHQALHCFGLDQIHDLRVACRRLRGAVEQLEPLVGRALTDRLRRPIRRLTRELGTLRNLDEAISYLEKTKVAGLATLLDSLREQRRLEAHRSERLLKKFDCTTLERQLREAATALVTPDNVASQGLLALLSDRNLALFYPIHALLPLAGIPEMVEERHALRIAVKKWRYFLELLHTLLDTRPGELLERLRSYQTALGGMNDRVVIAALLDKSPELSEELQQRLQAHIAQEQGRLLKKLRGLLEKQPLSYHFEL